MVGNARHPMPAGEPPADRLRVLNAMEEGLTASEVLSAALHHAVAALGGLGGLAHRCGPAGAPGLRLVVSSGLPRSLTGAWDHVPGDADVPPARAVRQGRPARMAVADATARVPGNDGLAGIPAHAGLVSVPVFAPGGTLGALSVLTAPAPKGEPGPGGLALLTEVARWAGERLRRAAPRTADADLRQALEAVRVGAWEWDTRTDDVLWSEAMHAILGVPPEDFGGKTEGWWNVIHPDDRPWVAAETDRTLRTHGMIDYEYRVRRPDGTSGRVQARGRTIFDDHGEPVRVRGTLWETREPRTTQETVGRALRYLSDGFLALDGQGRVSFLNVQAERLFGPSREVTGRPLWDVPAARAVPGLVECCRRSIAEGTPTDFDVRWPDSDRWYHLRAVPVPDGLAVYLSDVTEKRLRETEQAAAERAAAERASRIAEFTAALARAVTAQDVVQAVADQGLPLFNAAATVIMVVEGSRLRVVGSVGYSRALLEMVNAMPVDSATAISDAFRTGAPEFIESPEEFLARYPGTEELVAASAKKAWAFLPLIVSGRAMGSCVISFARPRGFSDGDRTLLIAASGLLAGALERARRHDIEHTRSQELQSALLPSELPELPAVTAVARYLPAGRDVEVGGDWYDVIPLSADRVALVIGDVMGHGLPEAATMGRLRTAVWTLSDLELPPDEVLTRLNDIVNDLGSDLYATCLYAVYDPTNGSCVVARAGHPPPAVVHPDGTIHFPSLPPNAPLGVATPPIDTATLDLPPGSLLVLYTDGLVESASRDIDRGMAQLAQDLVELYRPDGTGSLDALCDGLTSALLPARQQTSDDAALLVARTHRLPSGDVASWHLPEDPTAAGEARGHVREQLSLWNLDDLTPTTELLASELIGNVIRHAKGPILLRLLRSRSLVCEVSDASLTMPHIRRAGETDEYGRGLQLVAALAQRWGTRLTHTGKSIWTEQPLQNGSVSSTPG
ncbi:PAS domain S-box protein [Streptomyces sp. 8K308]|uniref:SpoIIE family protein phosphatase n=1 Tax=Streptomyces sp. 8K308 TaxID=2530388 RepID=UPI00105074A8|nr:SpoIIE family protein phosphatase [Streptomyces sp. 8K308]TDC23589.1 PAS domain S-box protein [Streptomyces sp. 8K308]